MVGKRDRGRNSSDNSIGSRWKRSVRNASSYFAHRHVPKPDSHTKIRWNILWFLIFVVIIIPLPIWLYPVNCLAGWIVVCGSNCWNALFLTWAMIKSTYAMWRMYRGRDFPDYQKYYPDFKDEAERKHLVHIVSLSAYKEPIDLIVRSVETLKIQTVAHHLYVIVGLEEKTPEVDKKIAEFMRRYEHGPFLGFLCTKHPKGIPGEIPGKCSNANYAIREASRKLKELGLLNPELTTVTTCDSDNLFSERYFEFLAYDFFRRQNRHKIIWQAPLLYNLQLDERPFFVRVTGILRSFLMMGIMIPQNINTMSVFSMSYKLLQKANYFHPIYQMDDIIFALRAMIAIKTRARIFQIPHPVISGPTSGTTYREEIHEWGRQARRWTVGAAEVFHYFCVKFKEFDFISGLKYGMYFTHYYGFILCSMSLLNLTGMISTIVYEASGVCTAPEFLGRETLAKYPHLDYLPLIGLFVPYTIFIGMFILDRFGTRLCGIKENISIFRNILHWMSVPLVLTAYSLVELYGIIYVTFHGKDVCTHDPSTKDNLGTANQTTPQDPSSNPSQTQALESTTTAAAVNNVGDVENGNGKIPRLQLKEEDVDDHVKDSNPPFSAVVKNESE